MIDTGQVLSTAELEQKRRNRVNRENDPIVINLRRQMHLQRKRIADNEDDLENYDKAIELDAQRKLDSLHRKLNKRINELS